jgi:acylglycerol lipase
VHGLAEYAGRYRDIAHAFAGRGISCFAYDQRGHGAQPGIRTHVDRFEDYVEDLRAVGRDLRVRYPELPLFVWGHSMGSVVATLLAATPEPWLRGVVTSSSSLAIFRSGPNPLNAFFRTAARIVPRLRIPLGIDAQKISSDAQVQRAYANDPLIRHTASLQLIVEFAAACEACRVHASRITLPWLAVHGEADAVAPVEGSRVLSRSLASSDNTLVTYPGLRHELHNEKPADRTAFLDLLSGWINERR